MQKLLRISSSGPILSTSGKAAPLSSLPFASDLLSKALSVSPNKPPTMHAAATTAFPAGGGGGALASTIHNKPTSSIPSSRSNCGLCRCSVSVGGRTSSRACLVLKDSGLGSRPAWLHTSSDGSFSVSAVEGCKILEEGFEGLGGGAGENPEKGSGHEKPNRLSRRQRGSVDGGLLAGSPDLLAIPGVGPRNLKKLVQKGIGGVAKLKQLYKDKFFGKSSEKMVEFLRSSVGIIHKNHAESITTYIKESVDEESKEDGLNSELKLKQKKRLTFCVEGNISVGKSTFLQRIANETLELRDLVEVVPEPINKWQDVGPDHFNILDAFYAHPERYAYTFQNYVFVTRLMQERESSGGMKPLRLMERSVFSDRMVFVRAVHEAKWMNEMEISIYDSWFDPVVSSLPGLVPDGFIYLRASPDTCHQRMKLRKRAEEDQVSLEYLRGLHEKHESWLFPFESGNHGVLSISKPALQIDSSLPSDIRDRVFYLQGDHMHSSIQKVPALVLDCEPNIDFNRDIDAKRQYARQVAKFFEFVKKTQEVPSAKSCVEAKKTSQQQILLPRNGELWVPGSALKSLDFRRAMSLMSG